MNKAQRLEYIDICKANGIILVILGHTYYAPQLFYNLIYSFHMPLFFVIAGYTFSKEKNHQLGFIRFTKRKAKSLLAPYYVFAGLNLLFQILWKLFVGKEAVTLSYITQNLRGIFFCYSSMEYMPNCSPIWFLLCLFIANLLFFLLLKMNRVVSAAVAVACMLICSYLSTIPHNATSFPWKYPVFLMAVFLMYAGYCFRAVLDRYYSVFNNRFIIGSIITLVLSFAIVLLTGNSVGMNENEYGNVVVFLFTAVPISCSIIALCKSCSILSRRNSLLWLGRNTIYIVGFNYLCREAANEIYYLIPLLRTHKISFIPLFILTMVLCLLFTWICSQINTSYSAIIKRGSLVPNEVKAEK